MIALCIFGFVVLYWLSSSLELKYRGFVKYHPK